MHWICESRGYHYVEIVTCPRIAKRSTTVFRTLSHITLLVNDDGTLKPSLQNSVATVGELLDTFYTDTTQQCRICGQTIILKENNNYCVLS
jgi:hypothetical protein